MSSDNSRFPSKRHPAPFMPAKLAPPKVRRIKIERRPLHDDIVPILRQEIIGAKWPPGQRLPEPLLCERFGVSRTPLRDALKVLAGEGLVELTHNSGAVVTAPTADDIEGKLALIELFECYAAREACANATDAELRQLSRLHHQMGEAFARRDMSSYYRLNNAVHSAIVAASHNSTLIDLHAGLWRHIERVRFLALVHEDLSGDSWAEHDKFVQALTTRNRASANSALGAHLRRVAGKINKELQRIAAANAPRQAR
ncbi:MAG: GntR family transcriptional regulator [Acidobacteriota bacterium]